MKNDIIMRWPTVGLVGAVIVLALVIIFAILARRARSQSHPTPSPTHGLALYAADYGYDMAIAGKTKQQLHDASQYDVLPFASLRHS